MSFNDKPGIPILGGYKLGTSDPMDVRTVAEDEIDLQSLIDNGAVYEGLEVYVKSLGIKKIYNGTEFVEIETGSDVEIYVEDDTLVINTDGTSSGGGVENINYNKVKIFEINADIMWSEYTGGLAVFFNTNIKKTGQLIELYAKNGSVADIVKDYIEPYATYSDEGSIAMTFKTEVQDNAGFNLSFIARVTTIESAENSFVVVIDRY